VIAAGVVDIPMDDIAPPEVGSLERRGETVEMRVLPTFSIYAPFFQSSRGYGLAVAGTTFGLFDLAKSDARTVSFRFETGTTAESRRLLFHFFVGPEYETILDEYTSLVGRPIVPPDWAFLHWRWRDTLDVGPPALLDGTTVNAEVADDVLMYDALGIPPGVYHFDRPVLVGNYGFGQWVWDETRLPNPTAMLQSLKQRGYHIMTWSGLWMCGNNGLEAAMHGYLAPGPAENPNCADIGGTSFIMDPTNPAAQVWWRDEVAAFLATYGIQGIKLDRGEEHIPSEATDIYADGRTGREVRNDYPTATSSSSRARRTRGPRSTRSSGAATSPAARASAPDPRPTSGSGARSSASSAPPSSACRSGGRTRGAITSSRTARSSPAGSNSAPSRVSWRSGAPAPTRPGTCRPRPPSTRR